MGDPTVGRDTAKSKLIEQLRQLCGEAEEKRIQRDTKKEGNIFIKLGVLYIDETLENKEDVKCLIYASGLINAALPRVKGTKEETCARDFLKHIHYIFLKEVCSLDISTGIPVWEDQVKNNKKREEEIRLSWENDCKRINTILDYYSLDWKVLEKYIIILTENVYKYNCEKLRSFFADTLKRCVQVLGKPPCDFAVLGLGSFAREEVTPYSDLEFVILVQDGKIVEYFERLTYYFHLQILDLGGTHLPFLAIPGLNDPLSPNKEKNNWYYDDGTPIGIRFDSAMPWASKTPIGREKTRRKEPLELIMTPVKMAELQNATRAQKEGYHLADVIGCSRLIIGSEKLYEEYTNQVKKIFHNDYEKEQRILRGIETLKKDAEEYSIQSLIQPTFDYKMESLCSKLKAKQDIFRLPSVMLQNFRIIFGLDIPSTWDFLEYIARNQDDRFKLDIHELRLIVSLTLAIRALMYNKKKCQDENICLVKIDTSGNQNPDPLSRCRLTYHLSYTDITVRLLALMNILENYKLSQLEMKYFVLEIISSESDPDLYYTYGRLLYGLQKPEKAILSLSKYYDSVAKETHLPKHYLDACNLLIKCHHELGEKGKVLEYIKDKRKILKKLLETEAALQDALNGFECRTGLLCLRKLGRKSDVSTSQKAITAFQKKKKTKKWPLV